MHSEITFNSLPDAIAVLLDKADVIISLLSANVDKINETSKIMDKEETLLYLEQRGYKMSISTLYKLTQNNEVPCMKLGNRLRFNSQELDKWLESKFIYKENSQATSIESCKKYIHKTIKK